ncbi:helix-turn-helix domain-containing protein [Nocardia sp. NBC_01327]|uniref:helix-turn-helix domain-containing protein n=1 Tax=Nocardia sp. NBC_01327 TaxID=2903593 RepID=UPI002E15975C|nr:helix-turn-helix domain-containing protein [Nocardia sp. NBC_01327]
MAKIGRRKRSRLTTQAFLSGAGTRPAEAPVKKKAEARAAKSAEVKTAEASAPKAAAAQPVEATAAAAGAPDIKALADKVKERRREKSWTQGDVAKQGGPAAGTISQIERCLIEEPTAETLTKLDAGLEWPADTAAAILRGNLVGA